MGGRQRIGDGFAERPRHKCPGVVGIAVPVCPIPSPASEFAIEAHPPVDPREAAAKEVFLAELDRLPHPFDQREGPVHVTGSAIVVGPRGVILVKHRRLHRWMQPGGHIEPGETPEEAAVRECTEETGLPVAHPVGGPILIHVDVHEASKGHIHLDVRYLVFAPDEDPRSPRRREPGGPLVQLGRGAIHGRRLDAGCAPRGP